MSFSPRSVPDTVNRMLVDEIRLDVCEDEFSALLAPFFSISPMFSDVRFEKNIFRLWQTDKCGFAEAWGNPFVRIRSRRAIQDSGHLVEVIRIASGSEQGYHGDAVIDRAPGSIYVLEQGQPMRTVAGLNHVQKAFVPKSILGLPEDLLSRETAIDKTYVIGRLLHASMDQLIYAFNRDPNTVDANAIDRFLALLKIALGVPPQREDVRTQFREALFGRIRGHIERNLSDPHLSTDRLLHGFGVSRAALYSMFERHNGVQNYIAKRRTIRAVLEIEARQGERGSIREAVERWGFSSQLNFNRTVRKVFDSSPRNLFQNVDASVASYDNSARILADFATRTAFAA